MQQPLKKMLVDAFDNHIVNLPDILQRLQSQSVRIAAGRLVQNSSGIPSSFPTEPMCGDATHRYDL